MSSLEMRQAKERKKRTRKSRRSIASAVIESAHCEHVDLVDCSEYVTDEMNCMITATGMTCCVCTAAVTNLDRWLLF